jgi:hypothetical protein
VFIFLIVLLGGLLLQVATLRGGGFHNMLVARSALAFQRAGYTTILECPQRLADGRTNFIDILASRGANVIACEVETTVRYVTVNAEKAGQLALPLWIIVPDRIVRAEVIRVLDATRSESCATWILLPDQIGPALMARSAFVFRGESRPEKKSSC